MPQQNSNKTNISSIMERNTVLSGAASVQKPSEINTADDATARLVKDDNTCIKIRAPGVHVQPACC